MEKGIIIEHYTNDNSVDVTYYRCDLGSTKETFRSDFGFNVGYSDTYVVIREYTDATRMIPSQDPIANFPRVETIIFKRKERK